MAIKKFKCFEANLELYMYYRIMRAGGCLVVVAHLQSTCDASQMS